MQIEQFKGRASELPMSVSFAKEDLEILFRYITILQSATFCPEGAVVKKFNTTMSK